MWKKLLQNSNYIIFLIVLSAFGLLFNSNFISKNILSIFPKDENIKLLNLYNKFDTSKKLFIYIDGLNANSLKTSNEIALKLNSSKFIKKVTFDLKSMYNYINDDFMNNYYLINFKAKSFSNEDINLLLQNEYNNLITNPFYKPINKNDPFNLFGHINFNIDYSSYNGYLTIKDKGYLIVATTNVEIADIKNSKLFYEEIDSFVKNYSNVSAFAGNFYSAQNSKYIESDVKFIITFSTILLLFLYIISLKNFKLLLNSSLTLIGSILFSILVTSYIFSTISIFTIVFGASISAIAIDYMFHNYFHQNFFNKRFNKSVFFGFLTTFIGFLSLSFVNFPLIKQISIFTIFSLSYSYLHFSFLYKYLSFNFKENYLFKDVLNSKFFIKPIYIFIFSIVTILVSLQNINLDLDFKNLDYQNLKLKEKERFFKSNLLNNKSIVLIKAKRIDKLIENSEIIKSKLTYSYSIANYLISKKLFNEKLESIKKYNFKELKDKLNNYAIKVGFRRDYFKDAYNFIDNLKYKKVNLNILKNLNLEVLKIDNNFYTIAFVDKSELNKIANLDFIYIIDAKSTIFDSAKKIFNEILIFGLIALGLITIFILFKVKREFFKAINFILFPLAIIILYLSFSNGVNLMHLFSLFIIIGIGIDYGIYVTSKENFQLTKVAIFYSLFSTFAGFGILILSDINAVNSIGEVVSLGILSILILLYLKKDVSGENAK